METIAGFTHAAKKNQLNEDYQDLKQGPHATGSNISIILCYSKNNVFQLTNTVTPTPSPGIEKILIGLNLAQGWEIILGVNCTFPH